MMNILHISTAHEPEDVRVFQKECVSLADSGYSVSLLVPCESSNRVSGVDVINLPAKRGRLFRFVVLPFLAFFRALMMNADLYHVHDFELWPVAVLLRVFGKKVVVDIHEDVPAQIIQRDWIPYFSRRILSTLANFLENNLSRFVSGLVVVDNSLYKRFMRYQENVVIVRNYPIVEHFKCNSEASNDEQPFNVWSLGGATDERCVDIIISASEQFQPGEIFVAGGVNGSYHEFGWDKSSCSYVGLLDKHKVKQVYQQASVLIVMFSDLPNHQEIKSNRLYESMLAGKPVIVSNLNNWQEFINRYKCGIAVDPCSSNSLSSAIQFLRDNPDAAKEMGIRGKTAVQLELNWASQFTALNNFYQVIMS